MHFFTVLGLSGNGHVDGGRSTWKFPFPLNLVSKSLVLKILTLVTVSFFSPRTSYLRFAHVFYHLLFSFFWKSSHMCLSVMEINIDCLNPDPAGLSCVSSSFPVPFIACCRTNRDFLSPRNLVGEPR